MNTVHRPRFTRNLGLILATVWTAGTSPLFAGDTAPAPAATAEQPAPAAEAAKPRENAFIRLVENDEEARLQTSVTTYENADGVKIDLIGAIHVADPAYYKGLNESFKDYEIVLYELVGEPVDKEAGIAEADAKGPKDPAQAGLRQLSLMMNNVLKLQHQVEGIDYTAANFVHADVTWEKFREMQKEKGESFLTLMRDAMKAQTELRNQLNKEGKKPAEEDLLLMLGGLAGALNGDPKELKLIMARQLEHAESLMGPKADGEGNVIIHERNKVVMTKLDEQLKAGKKHLGIFYGAGHFPDMGKRLEENGFKLKETQWRTAWDIRKAAKPAGDDAQPEAKKAA